MSMPQKAWQDLAETCTEKYCNTVNKDNICHLNIITLDVGENYIQFRVE